MQARTGRVLTVALTVAVLGILGLAKSTLTAPEADKADRFDPFTLRITTEGGSAQDLEDRAVVRARESHQGEGGRDRDRESVSLRPPVRIPPRPSLRSPFKPCLGGVSEGRSVEAGSPPRTHRDARQVEDESPLRTVGGEGAQQPFPRRRGESGTPEKGTEK